MLNYIRGLLFFALVIPILGSAQNVPWSAETENCNPLSPKTSFDLGRQGKVSVQTLKCQMVRYDNSGHVIKAACLKSYTKVLITSAELPFLSIYEKSASMFYDYALPQENIPKPEPKDKDQALYAHINRQMTDPMAEAIDMDVPVLYPMNMAPDRLKKKFLSDAQVLLSAARLNRSAGISQRMLAAVYRDFRKIAADKTSTSNSNGFETAFQGFRGRFLT